MRPCSSTAGMSSWKTWNSALVTCNRTDTSRQRQARDHTFVLHHPRIRDASAQRAALLAGHPHRRPRADSGQARRDDDLVVPESIEEDRACVQERGTDARNRRASWPRVVRVNAYHVGGLPPVVKNNSRAISPLDAQPRSGLDVIGDRRALASHHTDRNSGRGDCRLTLRFGQVPGRASAGRPAPPARCPLPAAPRV